jgi:precorrin-6B methylase 2
MSVHILFRFIQNWFSQKWIQTWLCLMAISLISGWPLPTLAAPTLADSTPVAPTYEYRTHHSRDGIGKFYMDREIAQVMGYEGAGWLERSRRDGEERPTAAIAALQLKPTDIVADIGAGTGYFSFRMAALVPRGKVLAIDVQPEMIAILNHLKAVKHISNVEAILGSEQSPNLLPASIDLALMVDVYHELAHPQEMMQAIVTALKPGGRVVLLEYRGENPLIAIKPLHKMTQAQVKTELTAAGLIWKETQNFLPQQHFLVFEKSA